VLSLRLTSPAAHLGDFVPGIARAYETTMAAEVTSSAGNAELAVSDAVDGSGRLANGPLRLAEPLHVKAQGQQAEGGVFAPLTADPLVLLRYAGPVGLDRVTITLRQSIGATEPLRTGGYGKTVTFTLSTTQP
jgi:hypothetical protein